MASKKIEDVYDLLGKSVYVTYNGEYHNKKHCPKVKNARYAVREIPLKLAKWLHYDPCSGGNRHKSCVQSDKT